MSERVFSLAGSKVHHNGNIPGVNTWNDLPEVLVNCNVHMYANNVQLYTSTPKENIDSRLDYINRYLVKIVNWASANGLHITPSKSKCIIVSNSNRSFVISGLSIRGNKIDFVKSATNLAIVLTAIYRGLTI